MSDFDSKDFGERLKHYRLKKGLSQENIATILGFSLEKANCFKAS